MRALLDELVEAFGLREVGHVKVVILPVNPGPLINFICASLEDTVKIQEETHTLTLSLHLDSKQ